MSKFSWLFLAAATFMVALAAAQQRRASLHGGTRHRTSSTTTTTTSTTQAPDYNDYDYSNEQTVNTTTTPIVTTARSVGFRYGGSRTTMTMSGRTAAITTQQQNNNRRIAGAAAAGFAAAGSSGFVGFNQQVNTGPLSTAVRSQQQDPWTALDAMRGKAALQSDEVLDLMYSARPGVDFPILSPPAPDAVTFQCQNQKQPGFYADPDFQCQGIYCDVFSKVQSKEWPINDSC